MGKREKAGKVVLARPVASLEFGTRRPYEGISTPLQLNTTQQLNTTRQLNILYATPIAGRFARMIKQEFLRIDAKRRANGNHRQKQFVTPQYKEVDYKHRLNFYTTPPTADITLEQFEQWAIDRLRGTLSFSIDSVMGSGGEGVLEMC